MLTFQVNNQNIKLIESTQLVSGTVGEYHCQFDFNEVWDGYTKSAIFVHVPNEPCDSCSEFDSYKVVLNEDNQCVIPQKALSQSGWLQVGIYGIKDNLVLPTVYSTKIWIYEGAIPQNP